MDTTLFEKLQKEFCPPLDSALVAALLGDFEGAQPSQSQLRSLLANLRSLAAQATLDESQQREDGGLRTNDGELDGYEHTESSSDSTAGLFDDRYDSSSRHTSSDTSCSPSDAQSHSPQEYAFTSPVGFLQVVLPGVPVKVIKNALSDAGVSEDQDAGLDMWDVIASILTAEYIREREERGLEALEDEEKTLRVHIDDEWRVVGSRHKSKPKPAVQRRAKSASTKVLTVGDIRQQRLAKRTNSAPSRSSFDPWTQLSSICSHLSTLLPSQDSSFFMSYFHSPSYGTPYQALCAALSTLSNDKSTVNAKQTTLFQTLLEVILPSYPSLDAERRDNLTRDIRLSMQVTDGVPEHTLDLVKLLRDLDDDFDYGNGDCEMGVYHLPLTPPASTPTSIEEPTFPPPVPPPLKDLSLTVPPPKAKIDPSAWKTVPSRKIPQPHRLALNIPSYNHANRPSKADPRNIGAIRGSGNTIGKGGKGDVGELNSASSSEQNQYFQRRDELLRQAAKMWQKGNARTRGGEVAQYYADKAREFQELAKKEALKAAMEAVEAKRLSTQKQDTIDLHGTTIAEAVAIVREILTQYGCSPAKPLRIITGRGKHSINQVGVLKPAIRKELQHEGWDVRAWEGGLVVHGRKR